MPFISQPIVVGDTVDFTLNARKDGSTWNITGATVTLYLQKPDATVLSPFSATVSGGADGIAHYQVATTVLSVAGTWGLQWKVSLSGVVAWSKVITFTVYPALA